VDQIVVCMAPGTNSGGGKGVNQVEGNESTLLCKQGSKSLHERNCHYMKHYSWCFWIHPWEARGWWQWC